jgi:hypothetical protein
MTSWEPARDGGFRRTGVAQRQSAEQITPRPVARNHPPVLRWAWSEKLGLPGCPYVIRWRLEMPLGSLRVHHWLAADDTRAFHDHPWWFWTVVLRGGYTDVSIDSYDVLRAGSVRFRHAEHQHVVIPEANGAWTVMITGPKKRPWGFWRRGKFIKANKWFATYGHHPCSGSAIGDDGLTAAERAEHAARFWDVVNAPVAER